MLTAKGQESEIIVGLELGADEHITNPFSPKVLLSLVRAVLRRISSRTYDASQMLVRGDLTIDPHRHQVLLKNKTSRWT